MRLPFSRPSHPSEALFKRPSLSESSSSHKSTSLLPNSSRDPHQIPTFDTKSLTEPEVPILYLPPLLSSLPSSVPPLTVPTEHQPLVTETRLPNIDPASLSLHKALHHFRPLDENYAIVPYAKAFNWDDLELPVNEEREWYCVVFRSQRKRGSDGGSLYAADKLAHEEAVRNGGLIMYWYGIPNPDTGMNLATCIWQSRKHAIAANSQPHHIEAMKLTVKSYEVYELVRYILRKAAGQKGVTIEPFSGGDVGW